MASINVNVDPTPDGIGARRITGHAPPFSTLDLDSGANSVTVYVCDRPVLDALQSALDAIRAHFDAEQVAEPEAVA